MNYSCTHYYHFEWSMYCFQYFYCRRAESSHWWLLDPTYIPSRPSGEILLPVTFLREDEKPIIDTDYGFWKGTQPLLFIHYMTIFCWLDHCRYSHYSLSYCKPCSCFNNLATVCPTFADSTASVLATFMIAWRMNQQIKLRWQKSWPRHQCTGFNFSTWKIEHSSLRTFITLMG